MDEVPEDKEIPIGAKRKSAPTTPRAAQGRNRAATTGQKKKPEPTLLGDFLLGRPSPNRPKNVVPNLQIPGLGLSRRKSLEDVKRGLRIGMSEENMRRVKQPGKVQVRVMQWQRENAKAAAGGLAKEEVIVVEVEEESGEEGVRMRGGKRPGRRKEIDDNEDGGVRLEKEKEKEATPKKVQTPNKKGGLKPATPKKRVISDDHWMKGKKKSPPRGPQKIPKNFLQATAMNPPLESKIKDWVNRTEIPEPKSTPKKRAPEDDEDTTHEKTPRSRKASRQELGDDGIRIKPSKDRQYDDGIRVTPTSSRVASYDDGIRVTPSKVSSHDDGIRITPSKTSSYDDGIRVRPSPSPSMTETPEKKPKSRKVSRQEPMDDRIRIKPAKDRTYNDGIRVTPTSSKVSSNDNVATPKSSKDKTSVDSIPITPSKPSPYNDGIRITPSNVDSADDGVRIRTSRDHSKTTQAKDIQEDSVDRTPVKPVQRDVSKKARKSQQEEQTPRKKSEKHLKPPVEFETRSRNSSHGSHKGEDDNVSNITPSPPANTKRRKRKSDTSQKSLDDIPFGNSAFSVLDLPVGAEAGTMKRPPPKRNQSFAAVPKVLKRVYTEGLKIVHESAEPPRGGPNQPPSIETWLNGTTDPFVEQSEVAAIPKTSLEVPQILPLRRKSYKEDDQSEIELMAEHTPKQSSARKTTKKPTDDEEEQENKTPIANTKKRNSPPKMESAPLISPLISPTGLKRSSATRNTSSPKAGRKLPLKEAIFDAFKGESGMKGNKDAPSPFDFIGLRERDINRNEAKPPRDHDSKPLGESLPLDRSRVPSQSKPVEADQPKPLPTFPRRPGPTTGVHRLSTIASVDTFNALSEVSLTETSLTGSPFTESSLTESSVTGSELSHTTITQNTVLTGTTSSSLSHHSKRSNPGLKRRLTKHSDLVSVLSLPDSIQRGKPGSIRSVRSLKKTAERLETPIIEDLMRELAQDETKYLRELNTLVDGVIPVLLTCVLSKKQSAVAAGLFNPQSGGSTDSSFTKPIVDMGVALERLKSLHKQIPLAEADAFLHWARSAHSTYNNYLTAWRAGFRDVVINLAPASEAGTTSSTDPEEMGRNKDGDVVRDSGERVDVAFLLKRPIVRIKKFSKLTIALNKATPSKEAQEAEQLWTRLDTRRIHRVQMENARLQDLRASNMDSTRARDIRTLFHVEDIQIGHSYEVGAADMFSFEMPHSSGQQVACKVEMILRDKASDITDGDLLICEFDGTHTFLLFPPISKNLVSARMGESAFQLVVMIRGVIDDEEWSELFTIEAEEREAAKEWLKMLGTTPIPPPVVRKDMKLDPELASVVEDPQADTKSIVGALRSAPSTGIPIGVQRRPTVGKILEKEKKPSSLSRERYRNDDGELRSKERPQSSSSSKPSHHRRHSSQLPQIITELDYYPYGQEIVARLSDLCVVDAVELEDAVVKAKESPSSRLSRLAARFRGKDKKNDEAIMMVGGLDPYPDEVAVKEVVQVVESSIELDTAIDEPTSPKPTSRPTTPKKDSMPLKESMRPEAEILKKQRRPDTPTRDDGAPPPPVHRIPTTPALKVPVLETPTPRVKRRTSSPLKHEYQPSEDASGTSSAEESASDSDSSSSGSYTDSSDSESESESEEEQDEQTELEDMPSPLLPPIRKLTPPGSIYSHPNTSLAPSNSASQGPYRGVPSVYRSPSGTKKVVAMISTWSNKHGKWEDLLDDPCSIVVGPGVISAYELTQKHTSPTRTSSMTSDHSLETNEPPQPLVQQILTPVISLRQSNAIDIEITSPATSQSILKHLCSQQGHVRYRTMKSEDCIVLYAAIHRARLNNPIYKKLEMERTINSYGNHAYEDAVKPNRRRSWLGRKRSYRASTRTPSISEIESMKSGQTSSSAFSALKRLSAGGIFNIGKSSLETGNGQSIYSGESGSGSGSSGNNTPMSPSLAGTSHYSGAVKDLGTENLVVRLYCQESGGKGDWHQFGYTKLSVSQPPVGMRQASSLNHGIERRIVVTKELKSEGHWEGGRYVGGWAGGEGAESKIVTVLDVVLGANCFSKMGTTGIVLNVWEDVKGDDGTVGRVAGKGGVAGRTRKWLLHAGSGAEREWIFGLVGVGR